MAVNAEQNQQYNQDENSNQQNQAPSTGGGGAAQTNGNQAPAANGSRVASSSSGQQAGSTGSGRFTNLSKYINANQGAGDRLGSGIENKVSRENEGAAKEADTNSSAVRQGIQSAQNKLATGDQYKQQVGSNDFNAESIANDPNKLQDFTQYRTGSAIDEAALAKQNQAAQDSAVAYQNQMQNQLGQTQTDNGRYGLLKQAFGGGSVYQNPYSQGQQRLDQLFLQSGGGNKIGELQNQLRGGINTAGNNINELTGQVTNDVNNITTQEADQSKAIQDAITGKTNDFTTGLTNSIDDVNAKRSSDQQYVKDQYAKLQAGQAVDQKFADMLGLNQGSRLYNIGQNSVDSYFNMSPAQAATIQDVASQGDVSKYAALAQLSGIDPKAYALTQASTLDPATQARTDAIQGYLSGANTNLANTNIDTSSRGAGSGNSPASAHLTGQQLIDAVTKAGVTQDLAKDQSFQNAYGWSDLSDIYAGNDRDGAYRARLNPQANSLINNLDIGVSGGDIYGQSRAKAEALNNALQQLSQSGYFNTLNINPSADQESGGQFGVT